MRRIVWLLVGLFIGTYLSPTVKSISEKVVNRAKVIVAQVVKEVGGADKR